MNTSNWIAELQKIQDRKSEQAVRRFEQLVDSVHGQVLSREIAEALFRTFGPNDDYGTQEAVIGALDAADGDVVVPVFLQELPRIARESEEWARILVAGAVRDRLLQMQHYLTSSKKDVKLVLLQIVSSGDFMLRHPNASALLPYL